MLTLVLYGIAAVAVLVALRLPRGVDLAVAVAFVPWAALDAELGISLKVSELVTLVLLGKYALSGRWRPERMPGIGYFLLFLLASLALAVITIQWGPEVPPFAGGSPMRNGYGRVLTTLIKVVILFGFLILLFSERRTVRPMLLLKTYVYSCLVLAMLGLLQFVVFSVTGVDIFPIGMFSSDGRSGYVLIAGELQLRVSSFGGEPKGLGQSLAIGLALLMVFGRMLGFAANRKRIAAALLFVVIVLTNSSSAFIVLLIVAGFTYVFSRRAVPFPRGVVTFLVLGISLGITGIYYGIAATTDTLAPIEYPQIDTFLESIQYKLTERVRLDDTDSLIMESFVGDIPGMVFGRGLGLVHHYAYVFIPPHMERYLWGSIVPPKSGVGLFLGHAGLLGIMLIALFVASLIPSRELLGRFSAPSHVSIVKGAQALSFGLLAALMLRLYTFDITWIAFTCFGIIGYQLDMTKRFAAQAAHAASDRKLAPGQSAGPRKPRLSQGSA